MQEDTPRVQASKSGGTLMQRSTLRRERGAVPGRRRGEITVAVAVAMATAAAAESFSGSMAATAENTAACTVASSDKAMASASDTANEATAVRVLSVADYIDHGHLERNHGQ